MPEFSTDSRTRQAVSSVSAERFLNLVAQRLRRNRPRFQPPEVSFRRSGSSFASIWFPTGGCAWDFQGYCTMCNFGHPHRISPDHMVEAVRLALEALSDDMPSTLWVSAFNVLDEREVPRSARRQIFQLLGETSAETILSESHPDSVTPEAVAECVELLDGKTFGLEVGIESLDDFVRRWCINKDFSARRIEEIIRTCHKHGATCWANLLLGSPFLSPIEYIEDVCRSLERGRELGFDRFVLFPNHVKPFTVVAWLHDHGLYAPPSLWSLVEILQRIGPSLCEQVSFSWVEPVDHPGAERSLMPSVDDPEPARVLENIRRYDNDGSPEALRWLFERKTVERTRWRRQLVSCEEESLPERMIGVFQQLSEAVLGEVWWPEHGDELALRIRADWRRSRAGEHP